MKIKKIPRPVFFLGLVSFFNDIAAEMIYPIVPIFLTSVLHAPMSIVGLIEGIAEGTASLGKFVFGYISDKVGRRKIFVVSGYGLDSLTKLLLGLATSWPLVLLARFLSRLGKGVRTALVIVTYMLYNLSQTIFATPAGSLADKIGARKVFALGLLVFSLVYFLFGVINNPLFLWLIFPIYGVYIAATDGVSKAYISEFITEKESGTYFGLYQTSISVAAFFASFIGGILWSKISPSATFFYGSFMSLAAFLLLGYAKLVKKI